MRKVWVIAKHEFLVNVRRPGFLIVTASVPILAMLGLVLGTFVGRDAFETIGHSFAPDARHVGVVDHFGAFTPIQDGYQENFTPYASEEAGREAIRDNAINSLLVIPENYMESGDVRILSKGGGMGATMLADSGTIRGFFIDHLVADETDASLRVRLTNPVRPVFVEIDEKPRDEPSGDAGALAMFLNVIVPYVLSILLIVTIFMSSGYLLRSVAEEKTSRVIEIIISSVTPHQLLAGKVLGLGALGLTQVLVWLATAVALSGGLVVLVGVALPLFARPSILVLSILYYTLGFLLYAVLTGSVGALGTNMQESQQLAGIFTFFAAVPFMMAGFMFSNPNMTLARVLSWFPLTAPTMMMMRIPMASVPTVDIVGSLAMLLVTIPIVLWAGAKIFRMGLLMYGKRPGVRQVWRTLREA